MPAAPLPRQALLADARDARVRPSSCSYAFSQVVPRVPREFTHRGRGGGACSDTRSLQCRGGSQRGERRVNAHVDKRLVTPETYCCGSFSLGRGQSPPWAPFAEFLVLRAGGSRPTRGANGGGPQCTRLPRARNRGMDGMDETRHAPVGFGLPPSRDRRPYTAVLAQWETLARQCPRRIVSKLGTHCPCDNGSQRARVVTLEVPEWAGPAPQR